MSDLREDLRVDKTPNVGENIKLLMKYIKKDKEMQRQFDEEDGIDVNAEDYKPESELIIPGIKSFVRYRNLKMENDYNNMMKLKNSIKEFYRNLGSSEQMIRIAHNSALDSLKIINRFAEQNGLKPIYSGKVLTGEEIAAHKSSDTLYEMTNAILELLYDLERYPFQEFDESSRKELIQIQNVMHEFNRKYKI